MEVPNCPPEKDDRPEEELRKIAWMLCGAPLDIQKVEYDYGDLTELNEDGLILRSVGKEDLREIARDYLSLLGTSSAIYEKNGDYACGIFSSKWCNFMDSSSRKFCGTDDNKKALESGKWLCHESCWTECAKKTIENGEPVEIECNGGIRMYGVPIFADGEIIGSMDFGFGDPPKDPERLREIAELYQVDLHDLKRVSDEYQSRPRFIIDLAKERLKHSSRLIGLMVESRLAKKKLEESRRRYKEIFEGSRDGFVMMDIDGRIMDANRAYCEMLGYSLEEIKQKKDFYSLTPGIWHKWEREEIWKKQLMVNGYSGIYEKEYIRKDGTIFPVELQSYTVFSDDGGIEYLWGIVRDITERKKKEEILKESEERFRNIFEDSPLGISIFNEELELLNVNKAICDMLGYTEKEILDAGIEGISHPEDLKKDMEMIEKLIEGEIDKYTIEKKYIHKTGRVVWGSLTVSLVRDSVGNVLLGIGMVLDITQKKKAEEIIKRENERAEFYLDLLGHDLGNIHQGIDGALGLMTYSIDDREKLLGLMDMARNSVRKSINLTKEVMLLSRIMSEEPDLKRIEIKHQIESSLELVSRMFPEKEIRSEVEIDIDHIWAEKLIREVFFNLLHNAVRLQGSRPWIRIEAREEDDGSWCIEISDKGPGISEKMKVDLFRKFGIKGERSRTGLGLSIVHALVKRYNGVIEVKDRVSGDHTKGARFVLRFPPDKA
ncbi:MAG: PAS domain S-box protein [Thermoplasmatota archaeon]